MPEWQGKSRGTTLGYRIFVVVCRRFGLTPAYFLLRFVALYFCFFAGRSTLHIFRYFKQRHGYNNLKAALNVYRNYYRFGQTLLDKIVVMSGIKSPFTYHFDGEENLLQMVSEKRGGILLSAHIGNWEVAGYFLQRLNTRIHVVMFDAEHEQIKNYLDEVTGEKKFNVIVVRDDLSHVYVIGEALQKNELVCMHADRFVENNKTKYADFLGGKALFPLGPFMLAAAFNVPVSLVFAFKESASHYHFFGSQSVIRNDKETKKEYTERLFNLFVNATESKVKAYPEQWFNYYQFWDK